MEEEKDSPPTTRRVVAKKHGLEPAESQILHIEMRVPPAKQIESPFYTASETSSRTAPTDPGIKRYLEIIRAEPLPPSLDSLLRPAELEPTGS